MMGLKQGPDCASHGPRPPKFGDGIRGGTGQGSRCLGLWAGETQFFHQWMQKGVPIAQRIQLKRGPKRNPSLKFLRSSVILFPPAPILCLLSLTSVHTRAHTHAHTRPFQEPLRPDPAEGRTPHPCGCAAPGWSQLLTHWCAGTPGTSCCPAGSGPRAPGWLPGCPHCDGRRPGSSRQAPPSA